MTDTFTRSDGTTAYNERRSPDITFELLDLLGKSISAIPQLQTDVALMNQQMQAADFKTVCTNLNSVTNMVAQHERTLNAVNIEELKRDVDSIKNIFKEFNYYKKAIMVAALLGTITSLLTLIRYFIMAGVL